MCGILAASHKTFTILSADGATAAFAAAVSLKRKALVPSCHAVGLRASTAA